nr:hypothetical protein [Tanacetum cinerariifolium]
RDAGRGLERLRLFGAAARYPQPPGVPARQQRICLPERRFWPGLRAAPRPLDAYQYERQLPAPGLGQQPQQLRYLVFLAA